MLVVKRKPRPPFRERVARRAQAGGGFTVDDYLLGNIGDVSYTVVSGDTLSKIGARFGIPWLNIAKANGIASPYVIRVGQKVTIPNAPVAVASTPAPAPVSTTTGVHPGASFISIWQGIVYTTSSWLPHWDATYNREAADRVVAALNSKGRYSGVSADYDGDTLYLQVRGVAAQETGTATIQADIRAALLASGFSITSNTTFRPLSVLNNYAPAGQPANPKPNANPYDAGVIAKGQETIEQQNQRIADDAAKIRADWFGDLNKTVKNALGIDLTTAGLVAIVGLVVAKKFL